MADRCGKYAATGALVAWTVFLCVLMWHYSESDARFHTTLAMQKAAVLLIVHVWHPLLPAKR